MLEKLRKELRDARLTAREQGKRASENDIATLAGFATQTTIGRFETSGKEISDRLPAILAAYSVVTGEPLDDLAERAAVEFGDWLSKEVDRIGPAVRQLHERWSDVRGEA